MLAGLGEDYDPLVTSITTRVEPISLIELYAHMLSFEVRKEHHNAALQILVNNVVQSNNSRGGRDGSRGRGGRGNNGGGRGKPNNLSPQRNGNRPQCQVCGKMGHVALKCYHPLIIPTRWRSLMLRRWRQHHPTAWIQIGTLLGSF